MEKIALFLLSDIFGKKFAERMPKRATKKTIKKAGFADLNSFGEMFIKSTTARATAQKTTSMAADCANLASSDQSFLLFIRSPPEYAHHIPQRQEYAERHGQHHAAQAEYQNRLYCCG